eukprot:6898682-Pyramimonas_sp.AAC.1
MMVQTTLAFGVEDLDPEVLLECERLQPHHGPGWPPSVSRPLHSFAWPASANDYCWGLAPASASVDAESVGAV